MLTPPGAARRTFAQEEPPRSNFASSMTLEPRQFAATDTQIEVGRQPNHPVPGLRVLLVDHSRTALPLARQLEIQGHLVSLMPDGRTTLGVADRAGWDLIWLDAQLADVPATWLAQWIRKRRPRSYVVLANRHCFGLAETNWRPAWVDAALPRPWLRHELEAVLHAAQARRDAGRPAA
jgi:hypothetical protein